MAVRAPALHVAGARYPAKRHSILLPDFDDAHVPTDDHARPQAPAAEHYDRRVAEFETTRPHAPAFTAGCWREFRRSIAHCRRCGTQRRRRVLRKRHGCRDGARGAVIAIDISEGQRRACQARAELFGRSSVVGDVNARPAD
jgi:hypothetical protein